MAESPVSPSDPSPPSHCRASIRHSERMLLPLLGDGTAVMAEKPGRNVAVTRHCAITSDDDRPQCSHQGIAKGTAVPLLHRFRLALEAPGRPVDARTTSAAIS